MANKLKKRAEVKKLRRSKKGTIMSVFYKNLPFATKKPTVRQIEVGNVKIIEEIGKMLVLSGV